MSNASVGIDLGLNLDGTKWEAGQHAIKELLNDARRAAIESEKIRINPPVNVPEWTAAQHAIKELINDARRASIQAEKIKINPPTIDARKAMDLVGFKQAGTAIDKVSDKSNKLSSALKFAAASLVGVFAASSIKSAIMDVVDAGGAINDMAQKAGVSTTALQEWGNAAELNGSDTETVTSAFNRLAIGMGTIGQKGSPAAKAFKDLGISLKDPSIVSGDLDGTLKLVANRLSKMPDGAKKTQVAMALVGKSGTSLIPTLNQGSIGLATMAAEARAAGKIIGPEAVSALDTLGDSIGVTKDQIGSLKTSVVVALLPGIQSLVTSISTWVKANKEVIAGKIRSFVTGITKALSAMGTVIGFAVDHWKALATVLGLAVYVSAVLSIAKAVKGLSLSMAIFKIESISAWAAAFSPVTIAIAAVAAIGAAIWYFRDDVYNALLAVQGFFSDLWGKIKDFNNQVFAWIEGFGKSVSDGFHGMLDWIAGEIEALGEAIANLPIIKQILWAVDKVSGVVSPGDSFSNTVKSFEASNAPSVTAGDLLKQVGFGQATATTSIVINAANADAAKVGEIVQQKLNEHTEKNRVMLAEQMGLGT